MFEVIAQGILDDPTTSFLLGLVVVLVIGFVVRNYVAKKKD